MQNTLNTTGVEETTHKEGTGGNFSYVIPPGYVWHIVNVVDNACLNTTKQLDRLLQYPYSATIGGHRSGLTDGQLAAAVIGANTVVLHSELM